ncbi:MAG: methionyl-tRNA formyltransferase [Campylobacterota bacterium]|nr:methionyl-tRNA formyltransferase [Campylobacterota bacterium]
MKIVFIGAVGIGYEILKSIYTTRYDVDTVFTLPFEMKDSTSGFIDFKPLAKSHNSNLIRVKDINEQKYIDKIKEINPNLIIVCGWQRLVCKEILDIPTLGTIGFHSSLLPKYRGRAPVNWAIIMGEKETGITMFYLTADADDGDIIAQTSFPILFNDDCNTIYKKSALAGAEVIKEYLPKFENNTIQRIHNPSASFPSYPKRTPKDGLIDFNRSALDIYNFVRALTKPYPGAYYYDDNSAKVIIWKVEIVFDESRLKQNDIVLETLDNKIRIIDFEKVI